MQKIISTKKSPKTLSDIPLMSVIMPLYNVEPYIRQSIDSVLGQSLGFLDNIQLILVNDGSTDGTADICREYGELYPNNVIFIDQKNQGVSVSRNNGLKKATGKYVNFFDGDDIWSKDAFKRAANFLDDYVEETDFVAFKIKFFDKIIDSHPSNYKFNKTRVIDLSIEPDNPIFHLPTCIFRRKALRGKSFDRRLKISEDVKFLNEVLVGKKAYGVSSKGVYNYRKRQDESSAIGGQIRNKDYYLVVPEIAYKYILDLWREADGRAHRFVQYEILSDLIWRLPQSSQNVLSKQEEKIYKKSIKDIVKELDDDVIINKMSLILPYKIFLLKMKHGNSYYNLIGESDGKYYFNGHYFCKMSEGRSFVVEFIEHQGRDSYLVEGYVTQADIGRYDNYFLQVAETKYKLSRTSRAQRVVSFLGDVIYDGGGFRVNIKLNNSIRQSIAFKMLTNAGYEITLPIGVKKFTGLSQLPTSYHRHGELIMRREKSLIKSYPYSPSLVFKFELVHWTRIMTNWKLREALSLLGSVRRRNLIFLPFKVRIIETIKPLLLIAESVLSIPVALFLRTLYFLNKNRVKKPIWIISDRGMAAGDNGEALFKYTKSTKHNTADIYYVISKKSPDYARLQKCGKVLNQDSWKYKLKFLMASKIISSHADDEITNPFLRQIDKYLDLFNFDFIFLQHGIIRHDLSGWLNRYNKNIRLFITSAQREYDSILKCDYYYNDSKVVLTGLPRYDYLENNPSGKLIIAPTYRKSLARMKTNTNGARRYDPKFKSTEYFSFYNQIINDQRLTNALSAQNMTGEFYLHPALAAQVIDFNTNNTIKVMDFPYNYRSAFNEGNLLVTDYSSIVFDFAYLKKPVIYVHFDVKDFYNQQSYDKGDFFSDSKDGFGDVVYSYETAIKAIISSIRSGCIMNNKYKNRTEHFYAYFDNNNSKRVYQAIKNLPDRNYKP